MKSIIIALVGSAILMACHNMPKNTNPGGFTINGSIKGMDSGWIQMAHIDTIGQFILDSVRVKGHKFIYKGNVSTYTQYFLLGNIDMRHMFSLSKSNSFAFFIEDTTVEMSIDLDTLRNCKLIGSKAEDMYLQYEQMVGPFEDKRQAIQPPPDFGARPAKMSKATVDSINRLDSNLCDETRKATASYIEKHPTSVIGGWALYSDMIFRDSPAKMMKKELYSRLAPSVKQSFYGRRIGKDLDWEEQFEIGKPIHEITENDTTGHPVSLSSLKGKYVLVDFWASWCGPCRGENPNVVAAYKKYKNKDFTVYSISLDENKTAWEKAIKQDGLTWGHVSELNGWKNSASRGYHLESIPFNILIDKEGKILAHELRGEELEKVLASVIK